MEESFARIDRADSQSTDEPQPAVGSKEKPGSDNGSSENRQDKAKSRRKVSKATDKSKSPSGKITKVAAPPWTFPKNTLEDAIKVARAIEEQNAGNPMKPDMLAKAVGFNSTSDWRFLDLLRSANQYGLEVGQERFRRQV